MSEAARPISTRAVQLAGLVLAASLLISVHKALVMAPVLGLLAVILLAGGGWRGFSLPVGRPILAVLGLFWLWCLISAFRAPDTAQALKTTAMLAGTILSGLVVVDGMKRLDEGQWRIVTRMTAIGMGVAAVVMLAAGILFRQSIGGEAFLHWLDPHFQAMTRLATLLAVLVWPVTVALWRQTNRRAAFLLVLLLVPSVLVSRDLAAKVSLILGCLVCLATFWRPRFLPLLMAAGMIAVLAAAPFATRFIPSPYVSIHWQELPWSAHHRLTIWQFVGQKIAEKPVLGWGFDSARDIPGGKDKVYVRVRGECVAAPGAKMVAIPLEPAPVPENCLLGEEKLPLHPHNAWLQVRLELGVIGIALASVFLALIAWAIARWQRNDAAVAAATMAAGFVVASVAFGAWQSWWLCNLWIAAGLLTRLKRDPI